MAKRKAKKSSQHKKSPRRLKTKKGTRNVKPKAKLSKKPKSPSKRVAKSKYKSRGVKRVIHRSTRGVRKPATKKSTKIQFHRDREFKRSTRHKIVHKTLIVSKHKPRDPEIAKIIKRGDFLQVTQHNYMFGSAGIKDAESIRHGVVEKARRLFEMHGPGGYYLKAGSFLKVAGENSKRWMSLARRAITSQADLKQYLDDFMETFSLVIAQYVLTGGASQYTLKELEFEYFPFPEAAVSTG